MKKLRQRKDFRVFAWSCFNACVTFAGTQLVGIEGPLAVAITGLVIPLLNFGTKYINVRYFGDLGVAKK